MGEMNKPRPCGCCEAEPGEYHSQGCDVERCARCGFQAISCSCIYQIHGIDMDTMEFTHPEIYSEGPTNEMYERWDSEWGSRRLRWTGFWPGTQEAAALGWFCVFDPKIGWVESSKDAPGAQPDLNRFYVSCKWDCEKQVWTELRKHESNS
jgi:hypothetical protein